MAAGDTQSLTEQVSAVRAKIAQAVLERERSPDAAPEPGEAAPREGSTVMSVATTDTNGAGTGLSVETSQERGEKWEGVLGIEGLPTGDSRYLIPGEIAQRDLPLPLMVQTQTAEGHDGAENAGRIEHVSIIPAAEFADEDLDFGELPEAASVIWGSGTLDRSECALEALRLIENGAGVSLDIPHDRLALIDPDTLQEVAEDELNVQDVLSGKFLTGIAGKIAGATIVTIPAFEQASVRLVEGHALVASAYGLRLVEGAALVASAAPLKPPKSWFENPGLLKLTPLTITDEGRVFGHLADWDGCHTGFGRVCVPPFRSFSGYAYFNVGEIETSEGDLVPVGKVMFSRSGGGHAATSPSLSVDDVRRHYDDATKVAAFVHAGSDRYGTWLAGVLRQDLTEADVQHLRTHPPSGDWRPIPGKGTELVASFSVPIPGFPIPRSLVASGSEGLTIITGPLTIEVGEKERVRRMAMLRDRRAEALTR